MCLHGFHFELWRRHYANISDYGIKSICCTSVILKSSSILLKLIYSWNFYLRTCLQLDYMKITCAFIYGALSPWDNAVVSIACTALQHTQYDVHCDGLSKLIFLDHSEKNGIKWLSGSVYILVIRFIDSVIDFFFLKTHNLKLICKAFFFFMVKKVKF